MIASYHDSVATVFQPIVSFQSRQIIGVEALSRFVDDQGVIKPYFYLIEDAQKTNRWLDLDQACRQLAVKNFKHLPHARDSYVSINIDVSTLPQNPNVAEEISRVTRESGLEPKNICLEILESNLDETNLLNEFAHQCREAGFTLALDDIGKGHSNLDRIALLKPDILKLDRSLIQNIHCEYYKQQILKSIIGLSKNIGALVLAEGVEEPEEILTALEAGVYLFQGFYLGKPGQGMPEDEPMRKAIDDLLQSFSSYLTYKMRERKDSSHGFHQVARDLSYSLSGCNRTGFESQLRQHLSDASHVDSAYVLSADGMQMTTTVFSERSRRRSNALFSATGIGTDHRIKDYFLMLTESKEFFLTDRYISMTTGNPCRTISRRFFSAAENREFILCFDVSVAD